MTTATPVVKDNTVPPPFDKLDSLCIRMQYQESGLQVKQQKYFRISVPQAFTGYELVQWLATNAHVDDTAEALHLATILCHHGYLFSVIERSTTVKEDNTLYRYQIPYFWPSQNVNADNADVEYAVYLYKRLMRNEDKHGLEDHEAEAFNKLTELLSHVWDFVTVQAEMQLKMHKEKKKSEKAVLDSQERAFWRILRPPPFHPINPLELRYGKKETKLKRKNIKTYDREIERLKFALKTKPWLKSPKATETMVSWCEQFGDYDPFLAGCQPSNPWISDDITHWVLNADFVEVPTERRVRRWGFSDKELVKDPIGRQVLETFLESEFSSENIRFWMAFQDLKVTPASQVAEKVEFLYNEFLSPGAPCQVNIDSRTLDSATKAMNDKSIPQRYCFSQAEEHIFTLMSKDSYPRFVRSEIYKGVLNAAQQQGTNRLGWRKFITGFGGKKGAVVGQRTKLTRDDSSGTNLTKQQSADQPVPVKPKPLSRGDGGEVGSGSV